MATQPEPVLSAPPGSNAPAARETARMLQTLIANIDGMVYRCLPDDSWTMEFVSDGCFALTGYQPEELLFNSRISFEEITHPEDRRRIRETVNAALAEGRRFDIEYRIIHRSGTERWVWERGIGLAGNDGRVLAVEGIIQDISVRQATWRALKDAERRYRSLFDNAIEGIFRTSPDGRYLDANPALARIYGFETAEQLVSSLQDIGSQLYVDPGRRAAFIEAIRRDGSVTGFESQVRRRDGKLIWISENARAVHDDSGRLVCYEGTVEDVTALHEYRERIERQARTDELTGLANRAELRVNGSVGIALYPEHGRDPESLLKNADAAMYLAKEQGRSTLRFFSAELRQQLADRLAAEQRLREAIRHGHLLLHYQPRVHIGTGRIVGAEALVRWQAPGGPLVYPASFISIAEETGLIVDIGRYVLRAACAQARTWQDAGHRDLVISINASPRELQQERYAETVLATLEEFRLPADALEIEITESMVVQDAPRLTRMLHWMQEAGIQIAIDDFGTGYSNLRYLQRFPAQRLKIDRSFIVDILKSHEDTSIVHAIITLGHNLGMKVVAEGVEQPPQIDLLRRLGCDEVQGFPLGRPMPASELSKRLREQR
jgi:PAS domain S-box-containing protein